MFRLGLVGCGGISMGQHGPAAAASRRVKVTACCDVREDAARQFAERFGCSAVYTDFREMVGRESLDGLLLATWPNQHRQQVEQLLQLGVRNILCEKALTLTGKWDEVLIGDGVMDYDTYLRRLSALPPDTPCFCEHLKDETQFAENFRRLHYRAGRLGLRFAGRGEQRLSG